jgi:DNA invertase Pin-like site-specific DNA recombinase
MKTVACYIRVSAGGKNRADQEDEIRHWLKKHRSRAVSWYIDKSTRNTLRRPQLDKLRADVRDGKVGTVIVWRLDSLSLLVREGLTMLSEWCDISLRLVSVDQKIDLKGKTIAPVLSSILEMDQAAKSDRTRVGLGKARARGRSGGRPTVTASDPRVVEVKKLADAGKLSAEAICKRLKISRATYHRYINL